LRSLRLKKYREEHRQLVIEGEKIITDLLQHHPESIIEIIGAESPEVHSFYPDIPYRMTTATTLKSLSHWKTPPRWIAVCKYPDHPSKIAPQPLLLFLNDIQDPGNMGTIIRTANWFGHRHIIASPRCADRYSPKVIQSSMGTVLDMHIEVLDWYEMVEKYTDHRTIAAHMQGAPITRFLPSQKDLVVIGNEGGGVSNEILEKVDEKLLIPGAKNQMAESLNAAISSAIICHHWDANAC